MALSPEWQRRIDHWRREIRNHFYTPVVSLHLEGFTTFDHLTYSQAKNAQCKPMPVGTRWGKKWEYGWFHTAFKIPSTCREQRVVLHLGLLSEGYEGEGLVFVNGEIVQAMDWAHSYITLNQSCEPDAIYDVWIESYAGHGPLLVGEGPVPYGKISIPEPCPAQVEISQSSIGIWNEEIYQLWLDVETLYQIRAYMDANSLRVSEIDEALRQFTLIVDFELPPDQMLETVRHAQSFLQPLLECQNGSTAPLLYTIGHGHLDVAWLWPLQETDRKIARTISNQLTLMAEYPEHKFIQSQAYLFKVLKEKYPELYDKAKKAQQSGNLIVEGGMWVESDTNLTSGESLIRQFLYGKRFFAEEFGVDTEILWLPDVFGYSGALPQIMKGCGINYFATQKIFWTYNGGDTFPYNVFQWEGIDGTKVIAHIFNNYNSETHPGELHQRWVERVQKDNLSSMLVAFGWGDGGGGPTRDHVEFLRRAGNLEGVPRTKMASPVEFFHDLEKSAIPPTKYVGELYFQAHRGTYTSQARTKKNNRLSELTLREAELWSAIATIKSSHAYPYESLRRAWQTVLLLQFHDILPGSSIQRVYQDAEGMHAAVIQEAHDLSQKAQSTFASQKAGLSLFNSLSWDRKELVQLPEGIDAAVSQDGTIPPHQSSQGHTWVEAAIPSCGITSLLFSAAQNVDIKGPIVTATSNSLENELLRVTINNQGEITSILDKETGFEFASGECNSLKMYKDVPNWFDAWDIDSNYELMPVLLNEPAKIEILDQGSLFGALKITRRLSQSDCSQIISLRRGSRTVQFDTTIDWQENHKLLKVAFPVTIHANEALHEIQFGHIARPNHRSRPFDASRFEVCNYKWTALTEENRGFAIINDSKYGVNVLGNTIHLTLLKSALSPDMFADKGIQSFKYAFHAWNGSFAACDLVREGYQLNVPIRISDGVSAEQSFFWVSSPNIVIDTIKMAEDQTGDLILRMYESKRMATRSTLGTSLDIISILETDMLEQEMGNLEQTTPETILFFKPFEIKTLRLKVNSSHK